MANEDTYNLSVQISRPTRDALARLAELEETTVSSLVRKYIRRGMAADMPSGATATR